jgi:hypothetical protein
MGKKIPPNNLDENGSESRNISEEDFMLLIEKEAAEWSFDNVEPHPFFKGAVFSFILCLAFWIILLKSTLQQGAGNALAAAGSS